MKRINILIKIKTGNSLLFNNKKPQNYSERSSLTAQKVTSQQAYCAKVVMRSSCTSASLYFILTFGQISLGCSLYTSSVISLSSSLIVKVAPSEYILKLDSFSPSTVTVPLMGSSLLRYTPSMIAWLFDASPFRYIFDKLHCSWV